MKTGKKAIVLGIGMCILLAGCRRQEKADTTPAVSSGETTQEESLEDTGITEKETETLDAQTWEMLDEYEKIGWKLKHSQATEEGFSYHVEKNNTVVIDDYTGTDDILVIPMELDGKPVETIGNLSRNATVEGVMLPASAKCMEAEAFADWTGLKVVMFRNGIETIGDYAFRDCVQLRHVYMSSQIAGFGKGVFCGCIKLRTVELPEGITVLKKDTFAQCKGLRYVKLPESLKEIEQGCFVECNSMNFLCIPDGVEKMESFPEKAAMIAGRDTYGEQYARENGISVVDYVVDTLSVTSDK